MSSNLTHENDFIRGQAFDCFLQASKDAMCAAQQSSYGPMQITSHQQFDWFKAPKDQETMQLHQAMLSISETGFLSRLVANKSSPVPNGSFVALQLLAFWLSWARKLHTGGNQLLLSRELLETLKEWSTKTDGTVEELDLADKLYKDFERFGAAKDTKGSEGSQESKDAPGTNSSLIQASDLIRK